YVRLDARRLEHVERLVELDRDVGVARYVERRAMARRLVLERIEGEEVHCQRAARDRQPGDVDVLRHRLQAEHTVEAEGDIDLDAVAQRLRLLHRPARDADDLVVDGPETLDADQQVADAGLLELDALLAPGERDRVGDERRKEADLVAVRDQLVDVPPDGRLAALDVDRRVAVLVAQAVTDRLRLLEIHEGVLGMILLLDAVEEVAEVTPDVARLAEPQHATPREQLLARAEVAGRRTRVGATRVRPGRARSLAGRRPRLPGGRARRSAGARHPTHQGRRLQDGRAPVNWRTPGRGASRAARDLGRCGPGPAARCARSHRACVAARVPPPRRRAAVHARPGRRRGRTAPCSGSLGRG